MPRLPRITADQLVRALIRDGWYQVRQRGSHVHLQHPSKSGTVTVPMHPGVIIKLKTLSTVVEQAELTVEELRKLL